MKNKQVSITHQLIYKNLGEGSRLCVSTPKTEAGIRDIPMTASVRISLMPASVLGVETQSLLPSPRFL